MIISCGLLFHKTPDSGSRSQEFQQLCFCKLWSIHIIIQL